MATNNDICTYLIIPYDELDNWNNGKAISDAKIGQTSYNRNNKNRDKRIQSRIKGMSTAFSKFYKILKDYCFDIPTVAFGNNMKKADDLLRELLDKVIACNEISKSKDDKKSDDPWLISSGDEWVYGLKKSHMEQLHSILEEYKDYIKEHALYGTKEDLIDLKTYIQKNPNDNPLLAELNNLDENIIKTINKIKLSDFECCFINETWLPDINYKNLSCCIIAKNLDEFERVKFLLKKKGCKDISVFFINPNKKIKDSEVNIYTINNIHKMPKFDYIIQNPPYSGSFHLEFMKKGLDMLKPSGKMTIIEPATWLINIRKNGKAELYNKIKKRLNKHVYKVVIENYNKEFDTAMYVPFTVTYIDMDKEYDKIDFRCCGEHRVVDNLYDCNMIGDYDMIWSILNKIKGYGEKVGTMKDHIYKEGKTKVNEETWFCKYADIIGTCNLETGIRVKSERVASGGQTKWNHDSAYQVGIFGEYRISFYKGFYHSSNNSIQNKPLCRCDYAGKETNKIADCLFGSKQELENWKHFVFNNKIPLFTSIVLVIDQHNTCKDVLCWLTDKQYTDEEIYKLLGITEEEQKFIDKTLKRYERHSPWFKRYMCGKDSVSDEEVQKFIDNL